MHLGRKFKICPSAVLSRVFTYIVKAYSHEVKTKPILVSLIHVFNTCLLSTYHVQLPLSSLIEEIKLTQPWLGSWESKHRHLYNSPGKRETQDPMTT